MQPRANSEWWKWKIDRNQARDLDTDQQLREAGWEPLRLWEHLPTQEAAELVIEAYRRRLRELA